MYAGSRLWSEDSLKKSEDSAKSMVLEHVEDKRVVKMLLNLYVLPNIPKFN